MTTALRWAVQLRAPCFDGISSCLPGMTFNFLTGAVRLTSFVPGGRNWLIKKWVTGAQSPRRADESFIIDKRREMR
jgi:hypothetical protein